MTTAAGLPYDPSNAAPGDMTPALENVLDDALDAFALRLRVAMPCRVVAVNGNQQVDLQPLLSSRYIDGSVKALPVLRDVLVSMPMGAGYSVKLPVAVGDTGMAVFCDRSVDAYAGSDGKEPVEPDSSRKHSLVDAVFFPGLPTYSTQTTDDTDDMVLTNGDAQVRLLASGKVQIKNGTQELLAVIDQLMSILMSEFFTPTMLGPMAPLATTIAKIQQAQTALAALRA